MNPYLAFLTGMRVLRQLSHDPRTIALMLVVPVALIGLLSWVFVDMDAVFQDVGPALLGLFPFILMFLVTSITMLRERRSGTLERLLTTPMHRVDIIGGYAIAFGLVAAAQAALASWFAVAVCGLNIAGEAWQLVLVAVLNSVLGMSIGLLVSAFAATEFQVMQFFPLVIIPQILLGGLLLPRDKMPDVLYVISDWLPLSHAVEALHHVAAGDALADAAGNIWAIVAFIVGSVILAALTLRKRTP